MHKIRITAHRNVAQQRRFTVMLKLVPAHVWHFGAAPWQTHNIAFQQTQPLVIAHLLAAIKEQVHSQTDTQDRRPLSSILPQRFDKLPLAKLFHSGGKSTYARQDNLVRAVEIVGAMRDLMADSEVVQRIGDASKVGNSRIDNGNHGKNPIYQITLKINF